MGLSTGTRLGPYEIVDPLGAGGMGEVYRARDTRLGRFVAIKVLPGGVARDPDRRARFEREARLLASLSHANIATIYGVEDVGGALHLVLEFVEGETLAARLARGPLPLAESLRIGAQIAAGLDAAHERSVVHRDLKPANVMLTPSGGVKILDFGLAKSGAPAGPASILATATMDATGDGVVLGTAPYMSPEQARGTEVDRRTDVWSFGCVLYECLTGRRAFTGGTASDLLVQILERDPSWSALPASVPESVRSVLHRCLTKEAAERPRDIGDLGRELSAAAQQLSSPPPARTSTRNRDVPSLAVLYFENLSGESESEYFCAGITEDILTDLSKIKGLRVASRNAVVRYRGQTVDIAQVGADLSVKAVLEGSVRRAGNRVRISAQLINASDGFHLWADRYDRTLEDVFAVQEEIASAITEALRVALTPAEAANLVADRPKDVRAYDLYLRGRERYGHYSPASLREALDLFQQAIAIDPDYALAWAGIADCYGQMIQWGATDDTEEAGRLGLEAARRAVAINPRLAEAHKAEGLVLRYTGEHERAEASLQRALDVNPHFTPALINLAVASFARADVAGAERLIRRGIAADPQEAFATTWLSFICYLTDRFDESLDQAARVLQIAPNPFYVTAGYGMRAIIHLARGDTAGAEQVLREGEARGADATNASAIRAAIAAQSGDDERARRILQELDAAGPGLGTGTVMTAATAALRLGERDMARRFLGRRILLDLSAIMVRLSTALHGLLDDPPFAPRRAAFTLVWPLEAPMIDPTRFAVFQGVRIESGRPEGSSVVSRGSG